jgi:DNA polymerase
LIPLPKETQMSDVVNAIRVCERCRLHEGRLNTVPGEGDLSSPVVLVGEAPGRKEDESGRPFVGSAGKLLDVALERVGLTRSQVYISNVVKCRPPGNRRPRSDEVTACTRFIDEQLGIIAPRVIAPMGNSALRHVFRRFGLGRAVIGEVHGSPHSVSFGWGEGVVFPLYHPAAILYNRSLEVELHADLEALVALLNSVSP